MASVRFEIRIDSRDPGSGAESRDLVLWARSGPEAEVEADARKVFENVTKAMKGENDTLYAQWYTKAVLLKGDPFPISSTPNQEIIETYTREPDSDR